MYRHHRQKIQSLTTDGNLGLMTDHKYLYVQVEQSESLKSLDSLSGSGRSKKEIQCTL